MCQITTLSSNFRVVTRYHSVESPSKGPRLKEIYLSMYRELRQGIVADTRQKKQTHHQRYTLYNSAFSLNDPLLTLLTNK